MRKSILLFACFFSVLILHAQSNNNGIDTLKQGMRNIGNLFKKAGTVTFTINGIDNNSNDLLSFKKNIQQTVNVKKIEDGYAANIATLKITYKGKATDLWNTLSANAKQAFTVNQMNDTSINLNYRYAKKTEPTSVVNNQNTITNNKSTAQLSDNSNDLSKGAALLFKNVKSKLTALQKNEIAKTIGLVSKDGKQFIQDNESADYPYDAFAYPTDMNKDGKEEIFILFGNSYTSGMTGSSIIVFIADKNDVYKMNLGFPGTLPDVLATANAGYPDLLIGGPGMEFPVWRWNGKEYDFFKQVKDADYEKLKKTNVEDLSKAYTTGIKN
jgi:hypothetical protein